MCGLSPWQLEGLEAEQYKRDWNRYSNYFHVRTYSSLVLNILWVWMFIDGISSHSLSSSHSLALPTLSHKSILFCSNFLPDNCISQTHSMPVIMQFFYLCLILQLWQTLWRAASFSGVVTSSSRRSRNIALGSLLPANMESTTTEEQVSNRKRLCCTYTGLAEY